jgi:hypothetical protein
MMCDYSQGRLLSQVELLKTQFAQSAELPFGDVLSGKRIEEIIAETGIEFRDRIYTPMTTLLTYLWQVLHPDQACQGAVAKLAAHRAAEGKKPCSTKTGGYCTARKRLPEALPTTLAWETGQRLHERVPKESLLGGRSIKVFDGSTLTMPDTKANQKAFPQHPRQKPGAGFPITRIGVLFSLVCGSVLHWGLCRYKGKAQSELALLSKMLGALLPGDIILADRYLCSYCVFALLLGSGVDLLTRLHQSRKTDFRRGRRLGPGDHLVEWLKPRCCPPWMSKAVFARLPAVLVLREVKVRVTQPGFRTQSLVVVTSLLDAELYPAAELAEVYRARWQAELNLRSLKHVMQMDHLRTKTPQRVRTEIAMHLLAYNLIRTIMAQTAQRCGRSSREISFKTALQMLTAFQPHFLKAPKKDLSRLYEVMLSAIAEHQVGDRPNRFEPRAIKKRPKIYPKLKEPRSCVKRKLLQGVAT